MNLRPKFLAIAVTCLGAVGPIQAQNIDSMCGVLINSGLRNLSIRQESSAYLHSVFRRHCESAGSVKSSSLGIGIDAVVKTIPIGLTGNYASNQEAMKNFCTNYSSTVQSEANVSTYEEKIVERAYDSFDQCITMAANGVTVRHYVRDTNHFDFFLAPSYNKITIYGFQVPKHVACRGVDPTKQDGPVMEFGLGTRVVLSGEQTLNVACERTGAPAANGATEYAEATVTMLTNVRPTGNYSAYLPPDTKLPRDLASEVQQGMQALLQDQQQMKGELEATRNAVLSGATVVGALNGHHDRWSDKEIPFVDKNGKPVKFSKVPIVVAVPTRGAAQAGVSWAASVLKVTPSSFTVRLVSVGRSDERNPGWNGAAHVQWIADARE